MTIVSIIRRAFTAGVMLACAIAPLAVPAAASAAESAGLLVSLDGEHYTKSPPGGLFGGDLVLAPGSHATQEVFVRNDSAFAGELRIAVSEITSDRTDVLDSLTLSATTPAAPGLGAVRLTGGDACTPILGSAILEPGESTAVTITLAMDASAHNGAQGATARADLRVSLRQPGISATDEFDCTAGTGIPVTDRTPETPGEQEKPRSTSSEETGTTDGAGSSDEMDGVAQPGDTTAPPAAPSAPATDIPSGVLAAPASGTPTASFPWIGVGALTIGAAAFLLLRRRNQRAD